MDTFILKQTLHSPEWGRHAQPYPCDHKYSAGNLPARNTVLQKNYCNSSTDYWIKVEKITNLCGRQFFQSDIIIVPAIVLSARTTNRSVW